MFATDMDDVMSAFFGGGMGGMRGMGGMGGGAQRSRRSQKGSDVAHALPVTLEDLYNGKSVEIERKRTVLCPDCRGRGTKSKRSESAGMCPACRGSGMRVTVRQMGMMIQQMQSACDACSGTGQRIDPRDRCVRCAGNKTIEVDAPLTVVVEKGASHRQQIPFAGMADESPDTAAPGDFIVVLQQIKHDVFVRQDCDLHVTRRISLAEALCGFQFKITHLDGRELIVRRSRGEITKPGAMLCVRGEGMPIHRQNRKFGDLVLEFEVAYPEHLAEPQIQTLRKALPPPKSTDTAHNEENVEPCFVVREDLEALRREIANDEEGEEEEEGGPSAGCAAQ